MNKYIAYDNINYEYELFKNEKDAKEWCENSLSYYRGDDFCVWEESGSHHIGYAKIEGVSVITNEQLKKELDSIDNYDELHSACFHADLDYKMQTINEVK